MILLRVAGSEKNTLYIVHMLNVILWFLDL